MITKKKILSLIALAIILVIVSVACSGNPTNAGDYIVAKQVEQSPQPEKKLTIDTNQGLIQFKDLSFKSGAYYINGNYTRKIYYYADVKVDENSKPYISAITKSEDGEIIEDEGKFYVMSNESGTFYKLSGVRYQSGNTLTAEATFTESGYLIIRFSNYSLDITYSLIEGTNEGGTQTKFKPSDLVGNWKCENNDSIHKGHYIVIEADGHFYCQTLDMWQMAGYYYIPDWNDIKDKEYTNFIVDVQGKGAIFSFNSPTNCIYSNKNRSNVYQDYDDVDFFIKE